MTTEEEALANETAAWDAYIAAVAEAERFHSTLNALSAAASKATQIRAAIQDAEHEARA